MNVTGITTVIACALVVQFLTNIVKVFIFHQHRDFVIPLVAMAWGLLIAFTTGVGFFKVVGIPLVFDFADYFITGVMYSAGAADIHELIKSVMQKNNSDKSR